VTVLTGHIPLGAAFTGDDGHAYSIERILDDIGGAGLVMIRHTTGMVCRIDQRVDHAGHGGCGAWYVAPDNTVTCAGLLAHPKGPFECSTRLFPLSAVTGQPGHQPPAGTVVPLWPPAPPAFPPFTADPGDGQADADDDAPAAA
jgi:hypothetical protein